MAASGRGKKQLTHNEAFRLRDELNRNQQEYAALTLDVATERLRTLTGVAYETTHVKNAAKEMGVSFADTEKRATAGYAAIHERITELLARTEAAEKRAADAEAASSLLLETVAAMREHANESTANSVELTDVYARLGKLENDGTAAKFAPLEKLCKDRLQIMGHAIDGHDARLKIVERRTGFLATRSTDEIVRNNGGPRK